MEFVYHNVDELRSGKQHWRILVKVVRIWYSQGFASSKLPLSLELVLMDDKGSKIHAIIKKTLMYKFEKLLVEGNVYSLSSFVLVDSSGDYKPTRHNYKICFMYNTEVRHMPHITIDEFPYSFVSLADILAPSYDSGYLIDVIGILTGVGVEREIVTNGKKSKMNVIEIESAGFCFEALDRTLNDIMKSHPSGTNGMPFGGKVVVLGGDFRQILPVIQKGSRCDIVNATINSSYLWKKCSVLKLTKNMRLTSSQSLDENMEITKFADWLLDIGDGKLNPNGDGESIIQIPDDLLILDSDNPIQSLIDFSYPHMLENLRKKNYKFFEERAILAPTLESVEAINNEMLSKIPGEVREYLSCDSTCKSDEDSEVEAEWFTSEFLNNIQCSGIPNHKLTLKVGVPIMLLRNIDQAGGLFNGTRMIVKELGKNVIVAYVVSGKQLGGKVLISRMDLVPSDSGVPFKFVRRQFPISLCFAMTINKSQGQTLSHVGLYLPKPVFTHGQLYVALSREKSRKGLKILILDEDGLISTVTKNVVYKEVFNNL
ncbi:uncharacterized protein LOC130748801 [Lotus japonicus]|uniref:uncharacterized protein LOC130748801 n=1 Tax=Lotus japonicus TaxID=34305 RepID=UPI00258C6DAB|nr:uncharacterized protein LOC130748801 [Lotus japonicus]